MQGKATIAGHPIHPPLVAIPIGCFVAAVASDIVSIWYAPPFWAAASTALLGFGIAASVLAGFFGFVDYLSAPMSQAAKEVASWHMVLNLCVIVLFGMAFVLRMGNHRSPAGYLLTVVGIVVLFVAGWLGGELTSRHLVGSSEEDRHVPRDTVEEMDGRELAQKVAPERAGHGAPRL